ncbi:hypothetical protein RIF29_00329 [Crotalaria pallida]|uniref:Legume lectin domain-containing protein n=1 Tax=Crotalaria pallida TaxID=3830 RepID=A0AAN9IWE6_CROPI
MSSSNTKSTHQVLLLASFITFFFILLPNKVHSSDRVSFDFRKFHQNQKDLTFIGNTSVSEAGVLRLNDVNQDGIPFPDTVGKALYGVPVHIWEGDRLASFITTFSFSMEAPRPNLVSDGLTFFLAPPGLPQGRNGGYFGIFNDTVCRNSSQIVLVEFDTHGSPNNPWDPAFQHIGINVNCIRSVRLTRWDARYHGEEATVMIWYNASIKTLTASLTYLSDETRYIVSAEVDLKAILPEWVTVGFTGTLASRWRETHDVASWHFFSILEANNNVALENIARASA